MDGRLKEGELIDVAGKHRVPVRNFIPRFVESGYADSFGEQWNRYRSVQIDGENKLGLTASRFYKWTGWKKEELKGLKILEAGCGAGRFTQVMLDAGADVYTFDLSSAVDACWKTNGPNDNLVLLQADIYRIPFRKNFFDRVFCYGVLQHTPDPEAAFHALIPYLREGGKISIDCYRRESLLGSRWASKFLWRPLTTRIPRSKLVKIVEWYIPKWLPVDSLLARIPIAGKYLVRIVPCWNYNGMLPLNPEELRSWAILDTFDALSPKYDFPQTPNEISRWFTVDGLPPKSNSEPTESSPMRRSQSPLPSRTQSHKL